jgi:hypothetical protein
VSFARWSNTSDVYVYLDVGGSFTCCGCSLLEDEEGDFSAHLFTTADMIEHLTEHVRAGHKVPDYCIARLMEEAAENDKWIAERGAKADG